MVCKILRFLFCLCVVVLFGVSNGFAKQATAQKTIKLNDTQALAIANAMVNNGNLDSASKLLDDIIKSDDENARMVALFEMGRVELARGNYDAAEQDFLTILNQYPAATFVRMELAKTYFASGRYTSADFNFRLVLADKSLSDAEQQLVRNYLNMVRKYKSWDVFSGFSVVPDSNLNYATGRPEECINTIVGPLCRQLEDRSGGVGLQYSVGGDYYIKLTEHFGIKTSASLYALDFATSRFDEYTFYVAAGPRYIIDGIGEFSVQPFAQLRWYGGEYYDTMPGVRVDADFDLMKRGHLSIGGSYGRDIYYDDFVDSVLRGNEYSTYIQPRYYINNKSFVFAGVAYTNVTAKQKSYGNHGLNYSVGYFVELPWTLTLLGRVDLGQTKYKDSQYFIMENADLGYFTRRDTTYRAYVRLSSRYLEYKRIYPSISYTYTKRNSNAPIYEFDKHRIQIEINYRL